MTKYICRLVCKHYRLPCGATMGERSDMRRDDDARTTMEHAVKGEKPKRKRSEKRAVLHMEVDRDAREAFFARAHAAGVSGPEYFANALARPGRTYDTDAVRIAKPLAGISYRLSRALDVLQRGEADAVKGYIIEAQRIVADALRPLRREHDAAVRANTDVEAD